MKNINYLAYIIVALFYITSGNLFAQSLDREHSHEMSLSVDRLISSSVPDYFQKYQEQLKSIHEDLEINNPLYESQLQKLLQNTEYSHWGIEFKSLISGDKIENGDQLEEEIKSFHPNMTTIEIEKQLRQFMALNIFHKRFQEKDANKLRINTKDSLFKSDHSELLENQVFYKERITELFRPENYGETRRTLDDLKRLLTFSEILNEVRQFPDPLDHAILQDDEGKPLPDEVCLKTKRKYIEGLIDVVGGLPMDQQSLEYYSDIDYIAIYKNSNDGRKFINRYRLIKSAEKILQESTDLIKNLDKLTKIFQTDYIQIKESDLNLTLYNTGKSLVDVASGFMNASKHCNDAKFLQMQETYVQFCPEDHEKKEILSQASWKSLTLPQRDFLQALKLSVKIKAQSIEKLINLSAINRESAEFASIYQATFDQLAKHLGVPLQGSNYQSMSEVKRLGLSKKSFLNIYTPEILIQAYAKDRQNLLKWRAQLGFLSDFIDLNIYAQTRSSSELQLYGHLIPSFMHNLDHEDSEDESNDESFLSSDSEDTTNSLLVETTPETFSPAEPIGPTEEHTREELLARELISLLNNLSRETNTYLH